jgi:hypothetical protein
MWQMIGILAELERSLIQERTNAGRAAAQARGLLIALNDGVTFDAHGVAYVQSASDPEVQYQVHGQCDCPDAPRAPEGRCKHRWSKAMVVHAREALEATRLPRKAYYAQLHGEAGRIFQMVATGVVVFQAELTGRCTPVADPLTHPGLLLFGEITTANDQRRVDLAAR